MTAAAATRQAWAGLLPLALVGTDRGNTVRPQLAGDVGALVAQALTLADHPATGLLRAAAVVACGQLAGTLGQRDDTPVPAPATHSPGGADTGAEANARLPGGLLALETGPLRLQHELLTGLAQAGLCLPAAWLPLALDLGRRHALLRQPLLAALGPRGRWLAAFNPDWAYAAPGLTLARAEPAGATGQPVANRGPDPGSEPGPEPGSDNTVTTGDSAAPAPPAADPAWTEGHLLQRLAWLQRQRTQDPAAARALLAATLPELPARERAELAAVLAQGLSLADESLLDALRRDRSREVRQVALGLLLRLPQAAHPQRAAQRLARLTTVDAQGLGIDGPADVQPDWAADNVDAVRPRHTTLGQRGWWLYQLVRQVPLGWWLQHSGLSPAGVLQWARGTDWAEAVVRGLHDVLLAAPDVAWCEAFLDQWPPQLASADPAVVQGLLPLDRREQRWQAALDGRHSSLAALVPQMLTACPPPQALSPDLSQAVAQALLRAAADGALAHNAVLVQSLPELLCALHPQALPQLAQLPLPAQAGPVLAAVTQQALNLVALRLALRAGLGLDSTEGSP